MLDADGFETCRRLKADPDTKHSCCIHDRQGQEQDIQAGKEAGGTGYPSSRLRETKWSRPSPVWSEGRCVKRYDAAVKILF
jgi:CheY-like chemotaxis protein